jgi:hypothetical protein
MRPLAIRSYGHSYQFVINHVPQRCLQNLWGECSQHLPREGENIDFYRRALCLLFKNQIEF